MTREHYLARLLRALSGKTQEQMAEETGVHPSLIGQIEQGQVLPAADHLARMAQSLGLTVRDAEEVLALAETLQRAQLRRGPGAEELLEDIARQVRELVQAAYRRILTLPLPESPPKPEDRLRAADLWARLEALEPHLWSAAIQISEELQSWALCEQVCAEAMRATARDAGQAVALGRLAREIAGRVR